MTPEWVLIVVAVIAALGGAAMGALINQFGMSRQASIAWQRDQQRHESDQSRADQYRLFDKRQEAYAALYFTIGTMRRTLAILARTPESTECWVNALNARNDYWRSYSVIRLIGSEKTYAIADEFLRVFDLWHERREFGEEEFKTLLKVFTDTVRRELGSSQTGPSAQVTPPK